MRMWRVAALGLAIVVSGCRGPRTSGKGTPELAATQGVEAREKAAGPEAAPAAGPEAAMMPRAPVATCVSQGVRFSLDDVQFLRTLDVEKGQTDRFSLHCRAESASRKDLWLMKRGVSIDEAVDETGRDLNKSEAQHLPPGSFRGRRTSAWPFFVRLNMPDARAQRVTKVRGRARFLAVTKEMKISFPEPENAQGTTRTKEGYAARLEAFRTFGDKVTAKVHLTAPAAARPAAPRPGSPRSLFAPAIRAQSKVPELGQCVSLALSTVDGREIPEGGGARGGGTYDVWFPARSDEVASVDVIVAREGEWVEVPFGFADFPLPETRPSIVLGPKREGPPEIGFSSELLELSLDKVTRSERLESSGTHDRIEIDCTASFREGAPVLAVSDSARIVAATDDKGRALTSTSRPEDETYGMPDEDGAWVFMLLSGAHPEAKEVSSLKGQLGLWLEEERGELAFDLSAPLPQEKSSGETTVQLQSRRREGGKEGYSFGDRLILTFVCSGLPGAETPGWWQYPECRLFDSRGGEIEPTGRSYRLLGGKMLLEYASPAGDTPPARAVLEYVKKARLVLAPFELKRIPVPWAQGR